MLFLKCVTGLIRADVVIAVEAVGGNVVATIEGPAFVPLAIGRTDAEAVLRENLVEIGVEPVTEPVGGFTEGVLPLSGSPRLVECGMDITQLGIRGRSAVDWDQDGVWTLYLNGDGCQGRDEPDVKTSDRATAIRWVRDGVLPR
jgi:hypothetical protein